MDEHRITEFFSGYIVNFLKHVRSTRRDAGLQRAVRSPNLEESLLNIVRPESNRNVVAHHPRVPELIDSQGIFYMPHNHMTCMPIIFASRKYTDSSQETIGVRSGHATSKPPSRWNEKIDTT
ncbi:hypothetical protein TNCV_865731 [Trichonephila clavipes]|nr:hypothetical protein TNCV_865731 [Trichonephila clavipes]